LLIVPALAPERGVAQVDPIDTAGIIAGASVGQLYESWEGYSGRVGVWTVMLGYRFNPKWALRGELGPGFEMCDKDAVVNVGGAEKQGYCHRHAFLGSVSLMRRLFPSTYMLFGPIHFGLGFKVPLGRRLSASGEVDLSFAFSAAAVRPRAMFATQF